MRPIYGCAENFADFLTTPTATFAKNLSWAFVVINTIVIIIIIIKIIIQFVECHDEKDMNAAVNVHTKFEVVALPVPDLIAGNQKMRHSLAMSTLYSIHPAKKSICLPYRQGRSQKFVLGV